jgi:hypothetical protein
MVRNTDQEREREIGQRERMFDISRDKVEKTMAALEEAGERGKNTAKLAADLERDIESFAESIENRNKSYALRNPSTPPVPPVEHFLELFKKNAAMKRAALNAARHEEAEARARETYDAALRASARPIAPVAPRRAEPPPEPSRPTCGDPLQDEINELEVRLNKALCELDYLDVKIRSLKLARMAENLSARAKANIDLTLADFDPPHEKKTNEVTELRKEHRNLMAQRYDAKKAAGKS